MSATTYSGRCFCGEVKFDVTGEPVLMGYCHCESCRQWTAAPVSAFCLWQPDAIRVTHGQQSLRTTRKTEHSDRKWCATCGGHVLTHHPGTGLIEICAALLPALDFRPALHVHYQEAVLPIPDRLPKMKDLPSEAGGSGVRIEEQAEPLQPR